MFQDRHGICRFGLRCVFRDAHTYRPDAETAAQLSIELESATPERAQEIRSLIPKNFDAFLTTLPHCAVVEPLGTTLNGLANTSMVDLQRRRYKFTLSQPYQRDTITKHEATRDKAAANAAAAAAAAASAGTPPTLTDDTSASGSDPEIALRTTEKKLIDFTDKLMLAPLTT